jgi:hypothetical protein
MLADLGLEEYLFGPIIAGTSSRINSTLDGGKISASSELVLPHD